MEEPAPRCLRGARPVGRRRVAPRERGECVCLLNDLNNVFYFVGWGAARITSTINPQAKAGQLAAAAAAAHSVPSPNLIKY